MSSTDEDRARRTDGCQPPLVPDRLSLTGALVAAPRGRARGERCARRPASRRTSDRHGDRPPHCRGRGDRPRHPAHEGRAPARPGGGSGRGHRSAPGLAHLVAGRIRSAAGEAEFGWYQKPGKPVKGGLSLPAAVDARRRTPRSTPVRHRQGRRPAELSRRPRVGAGRRRLSSFADPAVVHVDDARSGHVEDETVLGPRLAPKAEAFVAKQAQPVGIAAPHAQWHPKPDLCLFGYEACGGTCQVRRAAPARAGQTPSGQRRWVPVSVTRYVVPWGPCGGGGRGRRRSAGLRRQATSRSSTRRSRG